VTESIGEKYSNIIFSLGTLILELQFLSSTELILQEYVQLFFPFALILMMIFGAFVKKATFAKITVLKKLRRSNRRVPDSN
jgi:sulfite exporter TauE/SafE